MEQLYDALASLQVQMDRLDGNGLMPLHAKLMQAFVSEAQQFAGTASTLVQITTDLGAAETRIFELEEANNALRDECDLALRASEEEHAAELSQVETKLDDTVTRLRTAEARARTLEESYQALQDNSSQEKAALRTRLADADRRLASLGNTNERLAAQQEADRLRLLSLEKGLAAAVESSEKFEEEVNDTTVELLGERVEHQQALLKLDQISSSLAAVTLNYSSAQQEIDVAKENESRLQTQFEEGMAVAQKERDEFRGQCQAANAELHAVKAEQSSSQRRLEEALRERHQLEHQLQASSADLENVKAEHSRLQAQLGEALKRVTAVERERDQFDRQLQASSETLGAIETERSTLYQRLDEVENALGLAETSRSRFEQQAQESETKLATVAEQLKNTQDSLTAVTTELLTFSRQGTMDGAKKSDLQQQVNDGIRQRDDAVRQRDDALGQRDDAIAARDDFQRQLADAGATNIELQSKLDTSEEQLAQLTTDIGVLSTQVENLSRQLAIYDDEGGIRRRASLKRKREETPVDTFWRIQAEEAYNTFTYIHPDPQFDVSPSVQLHAARRVASVLGSRDGKNQEKSRLKTFCAKATRDVWFCFEAVTNVGWEAAGGVLESCPQHGTSCFQVKNTGNGVGFRLAQDIS